MIASAAKPGATGWRAQAVLRSAITTAEIRRFPPIGAADQFIDSTDALGDLRLLRAAVAAELRGTSMS